VIKIAFKNVFKHWRKSFAAILLIATGFAAVSLFEGYIVNIERTFKDLYSQRLMYGDFLINRTDAFQNGIWDDGTHLLSTELQKEIETLLKQSDQVDGYARFLNGTGLISNGVTTAAFLGIGYDLEAGERIRGRGWYWNTLAGTPLKTARTPDSNEAMVIGQGLGKSLRCVSRDHAPSITVLGGYPHADRPFDCLTPYLQLSVTSSSGQMNAVGVKVQGIVDAVFSELDSRYIALSLDKMQALLNTKAISFYSVALKHSADEDRFLIELNRQFRERSLPVTVESWRTHVYGQIYRQSLSFLHVFRDFVLAVTLSIVVLSVFSMLARLIEERTREIGTLRCIGFRNQKIRALFLSEAILISILGNVGGALLTVLGAWGVNAIGFLYRVGILSEKIPFQIDLPAKNFVFGAAAMTGLTCLAAYFAISRALRRKIPDCLAHH
jgi:putative ABC transport system permease protein